jgi:chromosomal replication initiation ATPase DnaA
MTEHKDVEVLLKNIQEGIRLYGVKDLNDAISKALYEKTDKGKEIEFVLNIVSNEFNITRHFLFNSKKHGHSQKAKQLTYCLLYFDIGLSLREIAKIFGKYVRSIAIAIEKYRELSPNFPEDIEFLKLYKNFQQQILEYINAEKIK